MLPQNMVRLDHHAKSVSMIKKALYVINKGKTRIMPQLVLILT